MNTRFDVKSSPAVTDVCLVGERVREQRRRLRMSQGDFAFAIREAGDQLGEPNRCSKRLVQKWERGKQVTPQLNYQRALEWATGLPFAALCMPIVAADSAVAARRLGAVLYGLAEVREQLGQLATYISPDSRPEAKREVYRAWNPEPRLIGPRLSAARGGLGWSQADLAEAVRGAAREVGESSGCTKRLVQKWEDGTHANLKPVSRLALERALGVPFAELCEPVLEPGPSDVAKQVSRLSALLESRCAELLDLLDYVGRGLAGSGAPDNRDDSMGGGLDRDVPESAVVAPVDCADPDAQTRYAADIRSE